MSSPYPIRPEHVQWLQSQLEQRQVKLSQGALLSLMTDFWTKNGSRLSQKKLKEEAATQILNNKLLDVLLSRFQKGSPAFSPAETKAFIGTVKGMEAMPPIQPDGQPNQTPQWVDRPSMGSLRSMKASEMDERMSQFNLDRDKLFPKPAPVNFTKQEDLTPIPTVPTDNLYEQLLLEREKQARDLGLSALSPTLPTGPDAPQPTSLSTSLNALQNATVPSSNPTGNQEMELRVANTLPRPVQGSRSVAGDPTGKRPMPRNLPTGGTPSPELTPEVVIPPAPAPAPALQNLPDNAIVDTGRLLPNDMEKQTRLPTREEFMKMAQNQARADFRSTGNNDVYDATGVFTKTQNMESTKPLPNPLALNGSTQIGAPVPLSNSNSNPTALNTNSVPQNMNGVGYTPLNETKIMENFQPMGPSFPGSTSSGMGAREEWRQNRDLYQAGLSGGPLPNPISEIGRPILPTYIPEYQTYHWYLTVDSINRDLEVYPSPSYFQVRFEEPDQTIEIPTRLGPKGEIIYEQPVKYAFSGGNGAKMERIYTNIVSLACPHAVIPLDITYVYGRPPYDFNGPVVDENKVAGANNFPSFPYGPIFKTDYGIPRDILDEPYLCLHVEELDGLYDGTSKTIRDALSVLMYDSKYSSGSLRPFLHFTTTMGEKKVYTPTALGKLSQMTLRLLKRNNKLVDIGVDKTFIASITQGDVIPSNKCDAPAGAHLTKITVSSSNAQYPCGQICGADVNPGNLLYFFTMFGCNPTTDATPLNSNITLNLSGYPVAVFVFYDPSVYANPVTVDITPFLSIGDIIIVNNLYLFDVVSIAANGLSCQLSSRDTTIIPATLTITSVSYIKKSRRGYQNDESSAFNYEGGQNVVLGDASDPFTFQIKYPYENLPSYLKSGPDGTYQADEAFFIRQNKQIVYSFEVVVLQPRTDQLTSRIFTDGGRPM